MSILSTCEASLHLKNNFSVPQLTILSLLFPHTLHIPSSTWAFREPSTCSKDQERRKFLSLFCRWEGEEVNEREKGTSNWLYDLGTLFLFMEDLSHRSCIKGRKQKLEP